MDQNIVTLIEQSKKYSSSKVKFFQTKLMVSLSPSKDYGSQVAQTENLHNYQGSHAREVLSGKNALKKQFNFNTFLLNYSGMNIDTLPQQKCDFLKIQMIDLQNNRFRFFPKEIYPMIEVQKLNLNSNFIKILPDDLFTHFPNITQFSINNNLIVTIPNRIAHWNNLQICDLSKNKINRLIPLKMLRKLKALFIQSNEFQIIPCEFHQLHQLQEFGLDWFKYLNPPIPQITCRQEIIQKLFTILREKELDNFEDPMDLNFSDEESAPDPGITFQQFIVLFSQMPVQILPNPQQGDQEQQSTIIHKAAKEQDIGALLSLISYYPEVINVEDQYQNTALGLAIQEEKYFSAKTLLFNGASVNHGTANYGSILNLAIVKGQIHLILDILNQGADPMQKDKHGNTALHYCMACFDKDIKIYKQTFTNLMKSKTIDPNYKNSDGWSPLHVAIKKGIVDAVQLIINYNNRKKEQQQFNLNLKGGKKRMSPLHLACQNCSYEIVLLLLNTNIIRILARNKLDQIPSDLCQRHFRLYKLLKKYEHEFVRLTLTKNVKIDQDDYSHKLNDSYTDLDESTQQFDEHLILKFGKINRSVLGLRERATGQMKRYSSQPPIK